MLIREPVVAGTFYSAETSRCKADLESCLSEARATDTVHVAQGRIVGGVVPHAGWACSGEVAARVFNAIAAQDRPDVVIVFGAIHVPHGSVASVFPSGSWETPLGLAVVDARLADRICSQSNGVAANPHAHEREHSIEVEIPFLQQTQEGTPFVPIMVPVNDRAADVGKAVGQTCRDYGIRAVFLASTDLTHYGPSYRFAPRGVGGDGLKWAKNVNDRRMIDLILALRDGDIVPEVVLHHNACGAGAIAATIAASKSFGAGQATLLEHTTSEEVLSAKFGRSSDDAVGYAAIILHE